MGRKDKSVSREYRPQGEARMYTDLKPIITIYLEPVDKRHIGEGEWVNVRDLEYYWEGQLADTEFPSFDILWPKGLWEVNVEKEYRQPDPNTRITCWLQSREGKKSPFKVIVNDMGNFWKGHHAKDDQTQQPWVWPKIAYRCIKEEGIKEESKAVP